MKTPRPLVTAEKRPTGLILKISRKVTTEELYSELNRLGFVITSAEKERFALFSCDEILKDRDGNFYFHPDYMIRFLADSLNLARQRDREARSTPTGLFLPIIEFEEDTPTHNNLHTSAHT